MALLNRFSKLNDRGETGIFTFIVTRSVTRDLHRDATTKDFCFGYHRWAISFQRPNDKMLGVHLLLRNASPNTACVVDFTLTLLNREHFSQNQVYSKRQAKFNITNPMQGVSRWIELRELQERRFSDETGEFLFELSLSNMTTIFECDIQLNSLILSQYKQMLKFGSPGNQQQHSQQQQQQMRSGVGNNANEQSTAAAAAATTTARSASVNSSSKKAHTTNEQLISLESSAFTFGSFEWSLTIVPLVVCSLSSSLSSTNTSGQSATTTSENSKSSIKSSSKCSSSNSSSKHSLDPFEVQQQQQQQQQLEPVCRIYLNRLSGSDSLCRVKYRVILGHHQPGGAQSAEHVDSKQLDQISDYDGRIRGFQFKHTNILKLISLRHNSGGGGGGNSSSSASSLSLASKHHHHHSHHHAHRTSMSPSPVNNGGGGGSGQLVDLRVHIEMFCANTISEAKVLLDRKQSEPQASNCSDRNKQAWCVEADSGGGGGGCQGDGNETVKLKLFFMDLQSVPRNHIRYISWCAYLVRRDSKSGQMRDSLAVKNAPHSNYYLQDGMDLGAIMDTEVSVQELNKSPTRANYLDAGKLTVHIEWLDSLLLFSHLYNNYDALATIQRHQISRELFALQKEFDYLEGKYLQAQRTLNRLSTSTDTSGQRSAAAGQSRRQSAMLSTNNNNNNLNDERTTADSNTNDNDNDADTERNAIDDEHDDELENEHDDTPNNSDGSSSGGPLKQNGAHFTRASSSYASHGVKSRQLARNSYGSSGGTTTDDARSTSSLSLGGNRNQALPPSSTPAARQIYNYDNLFPGGENLFMTAPAKPLVQSPQSNASSGSSGGGGGGNWRRHSGGATRQQSPPGVAQLMPTSIMTPPVASSALPLTPRRRLPQPRVANSSAPIRQQQQQYHITGYERRESNHEEQLPTDSDWRETNDPAMFRGSHANDSNADDHRFDRSAQVQQLNRRSCYLNSTPPPVVMSSPSRLPMFGRGGQLMNLTSATTKSGANTSISYARGGSGGGGASLAGSGAEKMQLGDNSDDDRVDDGGRRSSEKYASSGQQLDYTSEQQFVSRFGGQAEQQRGSFDQQQFVDSSSLLLNSRFTQRDGQSIDESAPLPLDLMATSKGRGKLHTSAYQDAAVDIELSAYATTPPTAALHLDSPTLTATHQMVLINSTLVAATTATATAAPNEANRNSSQLLVNNGHHSVDSNFFTTAGESICEISQQFNERPLMTTSAAGHHRLSIAEANRWLLRSVDEVQHLRLHEHNVTLSDNSDQTGREFIRTTPTHYNT